MNGRPGQSKSKPIENMKNPFFRGRLTGALLFASILSLAPLTVAKAEDFTITNTIASATSLITTPTNSITGGAISVANYERAGFTFSGQGTVTNLGNVVITLVRSSVQNPPAAADWETTAVYQFSIPMNGTTRVVWHTNLDMGCIGPAVWVGISSITNTASAGSITNAQATLTKKIIPIKFP